MKGSGLRALRKECAWLGGQAKCLQESGWVRELFAVADVVGVLDRVREVDLAVHGSIYRGFMETRDE